MGKGKRDDWVSGEKIAKGCRGEVKKRKQSILSAYTWGCKYRSIYNSFTYCDVGYV